MNANVTELVNEGRAIMTECARVQDSSTAEPDAARRVLARELSARYHAWHARVAAVLPSQDEAEFNKLYEGSLFVTSIKDFFADPLAINPLFDPDKPNILAPQLWTKPYDSSLRAPMMRQIMLIERFALSDPGTLRLPDRTIVLPKALVGYKRRIEDFLAENPYEDNVFVMMKYRDHNSHIASAIGAGVELAGKKSILAKNVRITDELGTNVMATLLCCKYGIALFDEPEKKQEINPNVAFELGIMHFLDRPCLLLKSKKIASLQTDILAKLYTQYDPAKVGDISGLVRQWILSTSDTVTVKP